VRTPSVRKNVDPAKAKFLDCEAVFKILEQKSADGSLMIEGYANTVDKDRVGDVVLPKSFEKSIGMYMDNPVLLYQHNWDSIIGSVCEYQITDKGLYIKAKISNAKDVEDIRTKIREGTLRTLSIGYNEVESDYDEQTKTKVVKELDLLEISVVTIPANPQSKFKPVEVDAGSEGEGKSLVKEKLEKVFGEGISLTEVAKYLAALNVKGDTMKTKNEQPGAAAGSPAPGADEKNDKQDGAPAPEAGAPEGGADEGAKALELLAAILAELKKMNEAKGAMDKPADEKPADEKPKDEEQKPEGAAPKSADKPQSDEEVLAELESVTAELERLQEQAVA
jgi:HK97 family phage prohead protease